ncbi:hypothetical protein HanXRQr2_Chr15g0714201 [Helianthus annuus]|uniref:Uncharacterized protein n=1 Tax=Helianthus annuus TaxID=4232 RepID=A0A9K3E4Q4_HELAN|nr:hypothetical protein HanXRQr2_Chr15g0714201 [Helianthus annuus]KAJ0833016.1 hypothetical protein HanPSC8_Chr15g0685391 [Helianthus annuus]
MFLLLLLPYDSFQNVPPSSSLLFYDSNSIIDRVNQIYMSCQFFGEK